MNKNEFLKDINNPRFNFGVMIIVMLCSTIITGLVEVPASANIGALLPYVFPPFVTVCSLIVYFISRLFIKKYNWVITVIQLTICVWFVINWK
jgi:hypothetical protein